MRFQASTPRGGSSLTMKGLLQPDQIGIHAVSEDRWIALVVATRDPSINLIVVNAGRYGDDRRVEGEWEPAHCLKL